MHAYILIFLLLPCILPIGSTSATSFQMARVSVEPSTNEVRIGGNFTIDVNASDVEDLYSFEFKLYYNTKILDGLNVSIPSPWPPTSESDIVETLGYVWVNSSLTEPPGISGAVTLASITFKAVTIGTTTLEILLTNFANSTGDPISFIRSDGDVTVTWNVKIPDDYPTIQEGINAANSGDVIFVSSDIYYEHVVVNKSVTLMGESRETTIVDGNGTGNVIAINSSNVEIKGFTIRNGGNSSESAILLWNSTGCLIANNIVRDSYYGLKLNMSNSHDISNNMITNNSNGLELYASNNSNIFGNTIANNSNVGIYSFYSTDNTISRNLIQNNSIGAWIFFSNETTSFYYNNFVNNTYHVQHDNSSIWDNGLEGNYWDDYNGTDTNGDGVGDTELPWQGADYKPLMSGYMKGDMNRDGDVSINDIRLFAKAFIEYWKPPAGKKSGYEVSGFPVELLMSRADFDEDCDIDIYDIRSFCKAFQEYGG